MKTISQKSIVVIILFGCILMFSACSNPEDEQARGNVSNNDHVVTNKNFNNDNNDGVNNVPSNENEENDLPNSEQEKEIPFSEFYRSKIPLGMIIKSKTEISDTEKEILTTMSEFDAVEVDNDTMLTLPDNILFDFDSDQLRSEANTAIKKLVKVIDLTDGDVTIVGHTDSHGEDDYNQKLSESRADSVVQALVDSGVKRERLVAEGRGATEPVAKNKHSDGSDNPQGRQKNRRVEVTIHGFDQ